MRADGNCAATDGGRHSLRLLPRYADVARSDFVS